MFLISFFSVAMWNFFFLWVLMECLLAFLSMKLIKNLNSFFYIFFVSEFSFSLFFLFSFLLQMKFFLVCFIIGKMGIFPMWFWIIRLFEEEKMNIIIGIFSFYKIIPLMILMQEIKMSKFLVIILMFNLLSSLLLLMYYDDMKKFMCFIFISSMSFLLLSFEESEIFLAYFLVYYTLSLLIILVNFKTNKIMYMILFVFLIFYAGIPPLPSFFFKIIVILKFSDVSFFLSAIFWLSSVILICTLWMLFVFIYKHSIWFFLEFFLFFLFY